MILDDLLKDSELQEELSNLSDIFSDIAEAVDTFYEFSQIALEPLLRAIRKTCGIIGYLIPVIIDDVKEQTKTKPPRSLVRCIGCRPKTQVPIRKNYRVQRR